VTVVVPSFTSEPIEGCEPCKAYRGHVAAISTYNGVPIIVMAASRSALVDVIKEINPNITISPALFMPASIVHDSYVKRIDDDL
jgi:hypothetical protein